MIEKIKSIREKTGADLGDIRLALELSGGEESGAIRLLDEFGSSNRPSAFALWARLQSLEKRVAALEMSRRPPLGLMKFT